jgi:hypothetical protein
MTDQHRATPEQLQAPKKWSDNTVPLDMVLCVLELRARIEALETAQPLSPSADKILALQDQIRDGALTLTDALKEIGGEPELVQPFTAKYLFTAGNIQQDSFYYDPSDSNSVSFDITNLELGDGCLTPGDNIKIAHRWGELPASGVYSTINYKVVSVSETKNRAWAIRAVRVSSAPDPTVRTMLPSGLPAIPDPITRSLRPKIETTYRLQSTADARQLTLVERVTDGLAYQDPDQARGAIRQVAAWLQENPGPNSAWSAVARDLMDEANR